MPRESYYQQVGNPLQLDRLPRRRPKIALPVKDSPWRTRWKLAGNTAAVLLAIIAAHAVLQTQLTPRSATWCHAALAAGAFVTFTVLATKCLRSVNLVALFASCLLWVLLGVPFGLPAALHLALAGLAVSVHAWLFAEHWIQLCTTTLLRRDARQLLRNWRAYNSGVILLPFIAAVLMPLTSPATVGWLMVLCVIMHLVMAWRSVGDFVVCLSVIGAATSSWLSYNDRRISVPGLFISPAGSCICRIGLSISCAVFVATATSSLSAHEVVPTGVVMSTPTVIGLSSVCHALVTWLLFPLITLPVLVEAELHRLKSTPPGRWRQLTNDLRQSHDPIERRSLLMSTVADDGSPVLMPRTVVGEHIHYLGDSGSGKTARGLGPVFEQLIAFGDCSVIVVDLKADSLELLATLTAAADDLRQRTGQVIPIKQFSNQDQLATHGFNPLAQPYWSRFNYYLRTDILCGATGLEYGADYGPAYYSSANAAVLHHTILKYPNVQNFRELAQRCGYVVTNAKKGELHPEIRKSGVHVHEVLKRLGEFEALNVCANGKYPTDVVQQSIDLTQPFRQPQLMYFHLSTTLGPGSSPALARLITYFLLAASTQTERRCPVYLVIDEFQRMVAQNIEYMLQLARSMGVGVILANQSMQDLCTSTTNLIPAIEANCRYRQWFSVSSGDDRKRLVEGSGQTVEVFESRGVSHGPKGVTTSTNSSDQLVPRLSDNDIMLASDHPERSIIKLSRGEGDAQYGGLPFVAESHFHITRQEYQRRKSMRWPMDKAGTFVPNQAGLQESVRAPPVVVSTEVIGQPKRGSNETDDPFADFRSPKPQARGRKARKKKP